MAYPTTTGNTLPQKKERATKGVRSLKLAFLRKTLILKT
jgi:hypothetical protein